MWHLQRELTSAAQKALSKIPTRRIKSSDKVTLLLLIRLLYCYEIGILIFFCICHVYFCAGGIWSRVLRCLHWTLQGIWCCPAASLQVKYQWLNKCFCNLLSTNANGIFKLFLFYQTWISQGLRGSLASWTPHVPHVQNGHSQTLRIHCKNKIFCLKVKFKY